MPFWSICCSSHYATDENDDRCVERVEQPEYQKVNEEESLKPWPSFHTGNPGEQPTPISTVGQGSPTCIEGKSVLDSTGRSTTRAEDSFFLEESSSSANAADDDLKNLPKEVQDELLEAQRLQKQGWTFDAEDRLYALFKRLSPDSSLELLESIRATHIFCSVFNQMQRVNMMIEALLDDNGWTPQKESDGIHVWTRPEEGSDLVTVRLAGLIEGPYDYFCALGKEVQHIKTWMRGVKVSHVVDQLNTFDSVGYYSWKFPFVNAREFLIEETTLINDRQGYLLVRRSPPVPRPGLVLPECQRNVVRAAISNWYTFSTPVGTDDSGRKYIFAVTVMNVDLKVPLPSYLVNTLSVKVGYDSFQQLRSNLKKSQDPSSPYHKSVIDPANAEYYGRMKALEKAREAHLIGCMQEILNTGWVKDPAERRKIFARSEGVLVPMDAA